MSALMDFPEQGLPEVDLLGEYQLLQDWGNALDVRHDQLMAIGDQVTAWAEDTNEGPDPLGPEAEAVWEAFEIVWAAWEAELDQLNEAQSLVDIGFCVVEAIAVERGVDLDEYDDELGFNRDDEEEGGHA